MANPQPDKFTPLSNELLEAIAAAGFNGAQVAIVLWVIRKSYGWHRKTCALDSWTTVADAIRLDRGNVWRQGQRLIKGHVLVVKDGEIGLQKDYEKWVRRAYDK